MNSVCQKGEFITVKIIKKQTTDIAAVKLKVSHSKPTECLQCLWNDTKLYDKEWWHGSSCTWSSSEVLYKRFQFMLETNTVVLGKLHTTVVCNLHIMRFAED